MARRRLWRLMLMRGRCQQVYDQYYIRFRNKNIFLYAYFTLFHFLFRYFFSYFTHIYWARYQSRRARPDWCYLPMQWYGLPGFRLRSWIVSQSPDMFDNMFVIARCTWAYSVAMVMLIVEFSHFHAPLLVFVSMLWYSGLFIWYGQDFCYYNWHFMVISWSECYHLFFFLEVGLMGHMEL